MQWTLPQDPQRDPGPADPLISDFWIAELWENNFLSHKVYYNLWWQQQEMNTLVNEILFFYFKNSL